MTVQDHVANYAAGWTTGDVAKIVAAAAPDLVLDDPNAGKIGREGLAAYVAGLTEAVAHLRNGDRHDTLIEMTDVVVRDSEMPVIVWAWFRVPGTQLAGAAVMKFDDRGIFEERIAYQTALPK
jgi:hypothetical protein